MVLNCEYCRKGVGYGHAVSHAKRRLNRIFKPNIQKLKVVKNGISVRVKFCTSCIQKLRREGHLGVFFVPKVAPAIQMSGLPKKPSQVNEATLKEEKARETLKIESIMGLPKDKEAKLTKPKIERKSQKNNS